MGKLGRGGISLRKSPSTGSVVSYINLVKKLSFTRIQEKMTRITIRA